MLQSFRREVTCGKRNLSVEKRDSALSILQKMVYCDCADSYKNLYQQLKDLDSPELMDYFNRNWHGKTDQWTLFGQNDVMHFGNRTNNRLERFNRDLQDTIKKYSSIVEAFNGMMIAVNAHRLERHQRAISMINKVSGYSSKKFLLAQKFSDKNYLDFLEMLDDAIFSIFQYDWHN